MIRSFKSKLEEALFDGLVPKGFPSDLARPVRLRLARIDAAKLLDDLRVPPGNRLEALKGSRTGQHSIRVNDQFRICFVWSTEGPEQVEFVDYH